MTLAEQVKERWKNTSMETILGEPELAVPLANYINGTGHFKDKSGEHTHT